MGFATPSVTTPEKWDSETRRQCQEFSLLAQVQLVLVDEVHLLGEDRGPCLEAVVSRMRTLSTHPTVQSQQKPCSALRIVYVIDSACGAFERRTDVAGPQSNQCHNSKPRRRGGVDWLCPRRRAGVWPGVPASTLGDARAIRW